MMIKPGEILCELEYLGESGNDPLIIDDLNHLMRQEAVGQRKHPQFMRLLSEVSQQVAVRKLEIGEQVDQQVEHGQHFLNSLIVELQLFVQPLFVLLELLYHFL